MVGHAVSYPGVTPERQPLGDISEAASIELPIDDDWRKRCRDRLRDLGYDQGELAAHIGCSQANISQALSLKGGGRRQQRTSVHAHAISLALGVHMPVMAVAMLATRAAEKNDDLSFSLIIEGLARQQGVKIPK